MKIYLAPMEGITGYIYRNAQHEVFGNVDKYFSPFIVPNQSLSLKTKDLDDILPENNQELYLVPQILTNNSIDFNNTAKKIRQFGYKEINLNLGCPSGTVVSKNRGAGFLAKREELDTFLEDIFTESITDISVKTRIGKDSPDEFYELIEIFNKYPIKELIIHPRIREDYYKNQPNLSVFKDAISLSKNPVCYNGDIFTVGDYKAFTADFPSVDTVMIGRGILMNPGMTCNIREGLILEKNLLKVFHDKILEDYQGRLSGDRNVLFKMKELWFYMITMFSDNTKYAKKIKKSERLRDYEEVVNKLFIEQEIVFAQE